MFPSRLSMIRQSRSKSLRELRRPILPDQCESLSRRVREDFDRKGKLIVLGPAFLSSRSRVSRRAGAHFRTPS